MGIRGPRLSSIVCHDDLQSSICLISHFKISYSSTALCSASLSLQCRVSMGVPKGGRPRRVLMGYLAGMSTCLGHGLDLAPQEVNGDAHSALARLLGFLHGPLPLLELRPFLLKSAYRSST